MEDHISSKNLKSIFTTLPTYFKSVYSDKDIDHIELVYIQKNEEEIFPTQEERKSLRDCDINTTLDVTGSPLEVDLCGNETFLDIKNDTVRICLDKDNEHFPVDIKIARSYLNQRMKTNKFGNVPIFVLCDGENAQKTVLIGIHKTNKMRFTCLFNFFGIYPIDHEKISLEAMQKSHLTSAGVKDCKINYSVHFKYYIYGTNLCTIEDIHNAQHFGSICLEMSCNKQCDLKLPRNMKKMMKKLVLQVLVGHKLSTVNFLWEELCLLQNYLEISSNMHERHKGETTLSATPIPSSEILNSVEEIVSSVTLLRRQTKSLFDLKNIRTENILDKLWNILKYCENLTVLRNAFHHFFEELAAHGSNMKITESSDSNIAMILNGIIDGKLAVPTITHHQALEFLFEIGAEKLKNDYRAIIKQFYVISDSAISVSAISVKWKHLHTKLSLGYLKEEKTNNMIQNTAKLAYLSKFHVVVEMIYLVKNQMVIPQETFDDFCKCVYMNYVEKGELDTSSESKVDHLYEFEVDIDTVNEDINTKLPISWTMQMKSIIKKSEITTVYHLSKYPIIPRTIHERYDIAEHLKGDEMAYYVYTFLSHKDLI